MTQITHRKNKLYGDILAADVSSQHVHYFLQCVQQKWKNSAIKNLCRYLNKWLYTRLVNSLFPMLNIINIMNIYKKLQIFFFHIFLIIVGFSMLIKNSRHTTYSALVIYQLKAKLKSSNEIFWPFVISLYDPFMQEKKYEQWAITYVHWIKY